MATQPRLRSLRNGPVGRQARILALQMLFAGDIRGTTDTDLLAWLCHDEPASSSVREASANMVNGVYADLAQFDEVIKRLAPAIPVNLLALVDRNILRVAIYELTNRDTVPRQVVVNEAVELASMFGSESSARFVNGVLGSYLADLATAAEEPDQLPGNPTVGGVPNEFNHPASPRRHFTEEMNL